MSESPADRFRRILRAWQEQKQGKQPRAVMFRPAVSGRADPPTPSMSVPETAGPSSESAIQTVPETSQTQPSSTAQPTAPFAGAAEAVGADPTAVRKVQPIKTPLLGPPPDLDKLKTPADARRFLERLRIKTARVVQDYSSGLINQRQFEAVYSHYQRQRIAVEKALIEMPGSGAWRAAAVEGHTSFLRQQHAAQVLGYAIFDTAKGACVIQVGDFQVDETVLTPMLDDFHSSTRELYGEGVKRTEIEGGRWLCGVPGHYTTLTVVFSAEPAAIQIQMIEDLHRDFEIVNKMNLSSGELSQLALAFTNLWAFEQGPAD